MPGPSEKKLPVINLEETLKPDEVTANSVEYTLFENNGVRMYLGQFVEANDVKEAELPKRKDLLEDPVAVFRKHYDPKRTACYVQFNGENLIGVDLEGSKIATIDISDDWGEDIQKLLKTIFSEVLKFNTLKQLYGYFSNFAVSGKVGGLSIVENGKGKYKMVYDLIKPQ